MPTVIVWGPPCSGKSTRIRQHMQPGDIVLDLDDLAHALAPADPTHAYPEAVRAMARKARLSIIDWAAAWGVEQPEATAWIVDSNCTPRGLARWRALGCHVEQIDTDRATCSARAEANRPPGYSERIAEWFAQHRGTPVL